MGGDGGELFTVSPVVTVFTVKPVVAELIARLVEAPFTEMPVLRMVERGPVGAG